MSSADEGAVTREARRAAFGLGSNQGDRRQYLEGSIECLASHQELKLVAASSLYETEPVGGPEQDRFLNAVVVVDATATPEDLLAFAQECEQRAGRRRVERWGPRTLDVDVLAVQGTVRNTDALTLPHPLATERAFVLVPWVEVDPGFEIMPGITVATAAQGVDASGVWRSELTWSVPRS